MPKRFTDTEKWKDDWWGALPNDYRIVWNYLVDSCSIAGVWKKDLRGLNFNCNVNFKDDWVEFKKIFGSRVIDFGNFFFIPKFLLFQYPKGLNSKKPAIVAVVNELKRYGLVGKVQELYGNDYLMIQESLKTRKKTNTRIKKKKKEDGPHTPTVEDVQEYCKERRNRIDPQQFVDFYASKGWMIGKNRMKDWKAAVRNWERRSGLGPAPHSESPTPYKLPSPEDRKKLKNMISETVKSMSGGK